MFNLISKKTEKMTNPWMVFENEMNDLMDRFANDFSLGTQRLRFSPKIDVYETGNTFEIYAEIPGLLEKDFQVSLKDNTLVMRGEKKHLPKVEGATLIRGEMGGGQFYRSIPLSIDVDPEHVSASYKDGILLVTLTKMPEAQRKVKKIPVQMGTSNSGEISQKH